MGVGVLLVTHGSIGTSLMAAVTTMIGPLPLRACTIGVKQDDDLARVKVEIQAKIDDLDTGAGVLVLTDIYGGTPSNVAHHTVYPGRIELIAGVSMPMLVRVFNYAHLSLQELAEKALSGGREGVYMEKGF